MRDEVARRRTRGEPVRAVAAALGLSASTVQGWSAGPAKYLGDGHLVTAARVPKLRIACADAYPGIAGEVDAAMHGLSGNRVGSIRSIGCSEHW